MKRDKISHDPLRFISTLGSVKSTINEQINCKVFVSWRLTRTM